MRKRKWTEEQLRSAAKHATSIRQLLSLLDLRAAGGNYKQITKYLKFYNVDTTHFRGKAWNKGVFGFGKPRLELSQVLIKGSSFQSFKLKKRLFEAGLKTENCELCGWAEIAQDGRMPLELHHINGDSRDNRIENLQVLCPNCHSLQPNHRGKNIKN